MDETTILSTEILDSLEPQWEVDLLPEIRAAIEQTRTKVVILDDDPTGTQTSKDLPVLTEWSVAAISDELRGPYPALFILTNSRSLTEDAACHLGREIGENLHQASEQTSINIRIISRSDSTLRGHFPSEVDAVAQTIGKADLPYLIVPFFLEGGRYTLNDIHYVKEGEKLVPAALTPFAKDAAFGFTTSEMSKWVEEKTGGKIPADQVRKVSLDDIRQGGPERVTEVLLEVPDQSACFVNCVSYRDMEVVVRSLFEAEKRGREFLYRTAASFVRTSNGVEAQLGLLTKEELVTGNETGGLFLVGSYVEKSSQQLEHLLSNSDISPLPVNVTNLLSDSERNREISKAITDVNQALTDGRDVVVYTSRNLITGESSEESLQIGKIVSESLIEIVKALTIQPRYFVAKGGITSSDTATEGLGVKRAMVLGQVQPGVPVWQLGDETKYPGMAYIIYPGNVGAESALTDIKQLLARE